MNFEAGAESLLSRNIFLGRKTLYLHEVARALNISTQHVLTLILEKLLRGTVADARTKETSQSHWRISTAAYDRFLRTRWNSARRLAKKSARRAGTGQEAQPRGRARRAKSPVKASDSSIPGRNTTRATKSFCNGSAVVCKGNAGVLSR